MEDSPGSPFRVRAILVHNIRVHVVPQVVTKDVHRLLLEYLLFQHEQRSTRLSKLRTIASALPM